MGSLPGVVRFGAYELDARSGELRGAGRTRRLQDKPLQLLLLLLEKPNEVITREEIGQQIWGSSRYFDFEDSLNQAVSKLREALGDQAGNPLFIETIPRRGYRFIGPVADGGRSAGGGVAVRMAPAASPRKATVGRRSELDRLRAVFDEMDRGLGRLVCLTGEPGIGKTTMIEDFLAELAAEGRAFHAARGQCSERLAGEEAYLPLLEALEMLAQANGMDALMRRAAPSWYLRVAPGAHPEDAAASDARGATQERMKREWWAFIREASRGAPLVLCIDDLHWADVSTVDALYYAGMRLDRTRVLILGTYRPSELSLEGHPFRQVQLELETRGLCRQIPIGFLTREDVDRYLALQFPNHEFPDDFGASIHARTEGSPLFMVGLLHDLKDRDVIQRRGNTWELRRDGAAGTGELPRSIRAMIERKIEKLSEDDRRLLCAASVQGHEFDADVAAEVVSMSPEESERRLAALDQAHDLVRLRGEHTYPDGSLTLRYRFVHALYQNALYDSLTPSWRMGQSAAVATALVRRYGEKTSLVAAELAHLFEIARQPAQASDYFLIAARNAASLAANPEAVRLARRAIEAADGDRGAERPRRLLAALQFLGETCVNWGRHEAAIKAFEEAETIAAETGDSQAQVQAICGQAGALFWLKRMPEMRQRADAGLAIASHAGDRRGVALSEAEIARERHCLGDLEAADSAYDRATDVLKTTGFTAQSLDAATSRILLHAQRLEFEEARRASEWWLEHARRLGLPATKHNFFWGIALGNRGLFGEALATLRESVRLTELNDDRYHACRLYNTLGWLHQDVGDIEGAEELNTHGVRVSRELGNQEAEINSLLNLASLYREAGELRRAEEHLEAARLICESDFWFVWLFNLRYHIEAAAYRISRGHLAEAEALARAALGLAVPLKCRKYVAGAHKLLGDIAALQDQPALARTEYQTALACLSRHPCPALEWQVLRAFGERAAARSVVVSLSESLTDERLRRTFLGSKAVRDL